MLIVTEPDISKGMRLFNPINAKTFVINIKRGAKDQKSDYVNILIDIHLNVYGNMTKEDKDKLLKSTTIYNGNILVHESYVKDSIGILAKSIQDKLNSVNNDNYDDLFVKDFYTDALTSSGIPLHF